jgi:hypothetical protein
VYAEPYDAEVRAGLCNHDQKRTPGSGAIGDPQKTDDPWVLLGPTPLRIAVGLKEKQKGPLTPRQMVRHLTMVGHLTKTIATGSKLVWANVRHEP